VQEDGFREPVTPVSLKVTAPVGLVGVPDVSATVTVQVVLAPTTTVEGLQLTEVELVRRPDVMIGFHATPFKSDVVELVSLLTTPFE
jgi:hypothetical protein